MLNKCRDLNKYEDDNPDYMFVVSNLIAINVEFEVNKNKCHYG